MQHILHQRAGSTINEHMRAMIAAVHLYTDGVLLARVTLPYPYVLLQGIIALFYAVYVDRVENVSSLIQAGADVSLPKTVSVGWQVQHDHGMRRKHLCRATCVLLLCA